MEGDTRKLQKVGGGTFTVSVPTEWATDQALSAGDTVHHYQDGDGSLVVHGGSDEGDPVGATVQVGTPEGDAIEWTVRAAYAAGVERLTLTTADTVDAAIDR